MAKVHALLFSLLLPLLLLGCGGGSGGSSGGGLTLSLGSSIVLAPQDGTPGQTTFQVTGGGSSTNVTVANLPAGVSQSVAQPGSNGAGSVTLTASPNVAAGTYSAVVTAQSGNSSQSQTLTIVVAVATVVSATVDTTQGVNGKWLEFMSTSFQPAEWDYQFFLNHPAIEPAQLNQLGSQHIRIQGISQAIPWKANSSPQLATDWDFAMLDDVVQPILSVTDHSPEFQIAVAPPFSGLVDSKGHLIVNPANLQLFSDYCSNLVRYYNTGGFTWGGKLFKSASPHHITWWGIFNEYNINGLTPSEYVQLYNAVVPAMLAVDPTIKFSALELSDYDYTVGDPRNNLPTFVALPGAGGVNAQVDVASTHFYSSCNQKDTDVQLFSSIPNFVKDVQYFRQQFATRADLADTPVWVTENNVNADFSDGNGNSVCNPGQKYVADTRGTSAYFAAWRPYVYSQLGKVGNQALYHWDYDADTQYSETDYTTGNRYLSYWVDYTLGQLYPVTATTSPVPLALAATETSTVEALATKNPDGSFVVMIVDRAVHAASDNNGIGDPRTVLVDVSALGNYSSVSRLTLDATTDVNNGPQPLSLTPGPKLSVTLNGYGTAFLILKP